MIHTPILPFRQAHRPWAPLQPVVAVTLSQVMLVVWAVWAAVFNTAQFGDNIEQFNWSQSLELGYHKHPPLPSWALGMAIRLFGPSVYWAYVLATLCLLGTATLTWLIGRRLVGDRVAAGAIVLWGLGLSFSQRAQLYNHNTVLILWLAATVWLAMRAADPASRRRLVWWVATGVAAAGAILSKYQALVPLAGVLVALVATGSMATPSNRRGIGVAVAVALLFCLPHAVWVTRHDFCTLHYASDSVEASNLWQRAGFIVSFIANQVRIQSPALLAILVCALLGRYRAPDAGLTGAEDKPADVRTVRIWMFGLLGGGLLVLVMMALTAGVSLRNHWGVQALQFLPIWMAWRWDRRSPIDLRRLVFTALAIHGASLIGYAVEHRDPAAHGSSRRIDTMYPARALAGAAVAHWTESTACNLHYVAGNVFDSGLVSLYSGGLLTVFDTASATPWVRPEDLRREGALYVVDGDDPLPPEVTHVVPFHLGLGGPGKKAARTIRIGILMPEARCVR